MIATCGLNCQTCPIHLAAVQEDMCAFFQTEPAAKTRLAAIRRGLSQSLKAWKKA